MNGDKLVEEDILFSNSGRVRNVIQAPDGSIYVTVENPGNHSDSDGVNHGMLLQLVATFKFLKSGFFVRVATRELLSYYT